MKDPKYIVTIASQGYALGPLTLERRKPSQCAGVFVYGCLSLAQRTSRRLPIALRVPLHHASAAAHHEAMALLP
jgi:hypothetical protein